MAQINKQDVMQKLIDELELYPAQDAIPNQLAEKIVPVFQVNAESITFTQTKANIVKYQTTNGVATQNFYTTPATGKFYLTAVNMSCDILNAGADVAGQFNIQVTISGTAVNVLSMTLRVNNSFANGATSLSFPNPILVDPGTNINLIGSLAGTHAYGNIIGYTEA